MLIIANACGLTAFGLAKFLQRDRIERQLTVGLALLRQK